MEVKYNVSGARRKEMVSVVSAALGGWTPKYMLMPSCSYQVGDFEITKDGTLIFSGRTDTEMVENVLETLEQAGFEFEAHEDLPEGEELTEKEESVPTTEKTTAPNTEETLDSLSISLPRESFTDATLENLDHLLEGKGSLIKKAFGIEEAKYITTDDSITFNWLHGEVTPEKAKAAQDFIGKLCEMARTQKRVNAKTKAVDNEKYAFRCFLLRLGLIGVEYKTTRKILMANLSGNASFKSGHKKETESNETTEA